MNEIELVLKAIIEHGFAPVMCLFIYINDNKKIEKLQETLSNNTKALTLLAERLGVNIDDGK